jgi:hypothetical protein
MGSIGMESEVKSLKPFSMWAKETQDHNPEIIDHWLNGTDPFKRAMAKTILEAAGEI